MTITATELRAMLLDGAEIALLDVREEAEFGAEHILLAVNLPLSRLELRAANLVPRRETRLVICDADDGGIAAAAASRLERFGYTDVAVLAGGVAAWAAAGYQVFSGMNVPNKAFGEFVEHEYLTPSVSAEELKRKLDDGEDLVILDSRPLAEYREMSIPGGTCVPGGELVYRVRELATDPSTLVVVNCAGRTRSIIGAQSLINAGIGNPVVALRNGTMGWHLAGLELARGQTRYLPPVSAAGIEQARGLASKVGARFGVRTIDRRTLTEWQRNEARTMFLLDVRSPEEYERGHIPGSISAPGGQLVQATDRYVGTLRARLVLVDDNGVRATMTASWLNQIGLHETAVLDQALTSSTLVRGTQRDNLLGLDELVDRPIDAEALAARRGRGDVTLLDLSRSLDFRKGHIEGARHGIRGRLAQLARELPARDLVVLTSGDGTLARYAFDEASAIFDTDVRVLAGGNAAWTAKGFPLQGGSEGLENAPADAFLRPYDRDKSVEQAMQAYLDWEIALIDKLEKDGTLSFVRA